MSFAAITVLVVLVVTVVLFVTEWVSFDVTALCGVAVLLAFGVIGPEQAFAGFSNPATLTIAALLVLSAALERTGMLRSLTTLIERLARHSPLLAVAGILLFTGLASAFVNNTAVVTLLIPVVLRLSARLETSPSRLLMPLSFVAIFGGICTLVGTSTNLLVSALAEEHGQPPISMFEMAPLGLIFFGVGFVWCLWVMPRLLPGRRSSDDLAERFHMHRYRTEVRIGPGFPGSGDQATIDALIGKLALEVVSAHRGPRRLDLKVEPLVSGDVLIVHGSPDELARLLERDDLVVGDRPPEPRDPTTAGEVLVEAVLSPDAPAVGQRLERVNLPGRFGATVLAVRHHGRLLRRTFANLRLSGGDSLLLRMRPQAVHPLRASRAFVVVSELDLPSRRSWKRWVALGTMVGVVAGAALTTVPIVTTALIGVCVVVVCRCLSVDEMYKAVNWKVIVLLAGVIPLGTAMETSGIAALISRGVGAMLVGAEPRLAIAGFFLLTMVLTNVMSNVAAAALLVPVAFQTALALDIDARPLLMTVTYGASLSFVSPIGYQTNTLVYGPGHYRFTDFIRVGTPLSLACCVIAVIGIPWIWPP